MLILGSSVREVSYRKWVLECNSLIYIPFPVWNRVFNQIYWGVWVAIWDQYSGAVW